MIRIFDIVESQVNAFLQYDKRLYWNVIIILFISSQSDDCQLFYYNPMVYIV